MPREPEEQPPKPFTSEPGWHQELLDQYIVENKLPGRHPSTTLLVCLAKRRNGETSETVEGQRFKLFMVLWPTYYTRLGGWPSFNLGDPRPSCLVGQSRCSKLRSRTRTCRSAKMSS